MANVLFTASDNLLEINGLTDALTGLAISSATVTCTLQDVTGATVTGQTFPLTLAAQATAGNYAATLAAALALVAGATYYALITINAGAGKTRVLKFPLLAKQDDGLSGA